MFVLIKSKN